LIELEGVDKHMIKTMYNYNLNKARQMKEELEEVRQEYIYGKQHPDPITE
jgi:hypothetical protein